MTPMFTMTISDRKGTILAKGASLPGEQWKKTLLRLYHAMLPLSAPRRQISYSTRLAGQTGGATNSVIVVYRDTKVTAATEALFIHTDPPQF